MSRVAAILCVFAGSIFAAFGLLVLFTKISSLDPRGLLIAAAFVVAAYTCFRTAGRLWRPQRREV